MKKISFRTDVLPLKNELFRLALRITLNREDAEDVVQETMIRVWNRRDQWEQIESIEAFCTTIQQPGRIARQRGARRTRPFIQRQSGRTGCTARQSGTREKTDGSAARETAHLHAAARRGREIVQGNRHGDGHQRTASEGKHLPSPTNNKTRIFETRKIWIISTSNNCWTATLRPKRP